MKKIISIISIALVMSLMFVSCGSATTGETETPQQLDSTFSCDISAVYNNISLTGTFSANGVDNFTVIIEDAGAAGDVKVTYDKGKLSYNAFGVEVQVTKDNLPQAAILPVIIAVLTIFIDTPQSGGVIKDDTVAYTGTTEAGDYTVEFTRDPFRPKTISFVGDLSLNVNFSNFK